MVCLDERDLHAARVGDGRCDVKRERVHPLRVDAEHVDDQVRGALRAVDRPAIPRRRQICVVVRVCVSTDVPSLSSTESLRNGKPGLREEVRCDTWDGLVAEGIDGDRHALHDFVEWRLPPPAVALRRSEATVFYGRRFFPCLVLFV